MPVQLRHDYEGYNIFYTKIRSNSFAHRPDFHLCLLISHTYNSACRIAYGFKWEWFQLSVVVKVAAVCSGRTERVA
jgi:hypothetical protein